MPTQTHKYKVRWDQAHTSKN